MQRLFIITLAVAVTLTASLGAFLFATLWPFYTIIGRVAAGVVITGLICLALLMVSFTFSKIGIWRAQHYHERIQSRVIVAGEVVVFPHDDGSFTHLSAMHEAARHPAQMQIAAPKEEEQSEADEKVIRELHSKGLNLRDIARITNSSYYRVQKVTSSTD